MRRGLVDFRARHLLAPSSVVPARGQHGRGRFFLVSPVLIIEESKAFT